MVFVTIPLDLQPETNIFANVSVEDFKKIRAVSDHALILIPRPLTRFWVQGLGSQCWILSTGFWVQGLGSQC